MLNKNAESCLHGYSVVSMLCDLHTQHSFKGVEEDIGTLEYYIV